MHVLAKANYRVISIYDYYQDDSKPVIGFLYTKTGFSLSIFDAVFKAILYFDSVGS